MAIHLYRPQRTPIETLLACNVGRSHFVESVLDDLRSRYSGDSRQHFMFIGPRGIGKTTLLRLIAHGITQDPDLATRYLPIALPEEGYSLSRVSDFMVHMVQILSQDLGRDELAGVYDQVRHDDDHQRVVDRVVEAMRGFHSQTGLGVVLMFENAHRFLERQKRNKDELHLLRSLMMSETWLTGIFTSPTYLNALVDAKEPFFEFFKVLTLGELTQDELLEVLHKLTEHENNQVFREYLAKHSSRVRALYHFTGGNPRLTLMLYELVTKHDIVGVREELDQLLDQITPFYQDRMKDLSEQEAKVIEAMSLIPEGCTPKDLARETRLGGGTTRMVLTRLENAGYVKHEKRSDRKTIYYIQERLFRIWNSMNNSRSSQIKQHYLVEFFRTWYTEKPDRDREWSNLIFELNTSISSNNPRQYNNIAQYMQLLLSICDKQEAYFRLQENLRYIATHHSDESLDVYTFIRLFDIHAGNFDSESLIILGIFGNTHTSSVDEFKNILTSYQKNYSNNAFGSYVSLVTGYSSSPEGVHEFIKNKNHCITTHDDQSVSSLAFILMLNAYHITHADRTEVSDYCYLASERIFLEIFENFDIASLLLLRDKIAFLHTDILKYSPHVKISIEYLHHLRSPAILEKHAPEVREAALKLVEAFDSNPANSPPGGPNSGS